MKVNYLKHEYLEIVLVNCAYLYEYEYVYEYICFDILLSYFQCRSLLKLLILMGVETYMIPYGRLEMNYCDVETH
jgi:hypothetical protein